MNKTLWLAAAALLAAIALPSCKKEGTAVIIGTGHQYEPFCYYNADGELTGLDIAVVKEIDRRLTEYTFRFEVFDFANVLVSLAAGKADVGAHEFEENPDRRAAYLYGEEGYNDYDSWLTVKADGPWAQIKTLDDIAGNPDAVIGVSLGSNHEAFVKTWNQTHDAEHQLASQVYNQTEVWLTNMGNGTFAAGLSTQFDIDLRNTLSPGISLTAVGSAPVILSKAYFIFRKDGAELQRAFDRTLRDMKADGTLNRIRDETFSAYFRSF
ncbi:MAG: transporter substrate-binding domain-containing protein [Treponema sp.]|nr:transporter substrate-binding domain-containing protein [Treponema sp.]